MKVLSAIGAFFARIGRWIKETAWIQPLLIVGAIFAIIFAIPHIINGVKGWFDESDAANKYFNKYSLSLNNAIEKEGAFVGTSKVDDLFTYIEDGEVDKVKSITKEDKFFIAFVEENNSSCKDLYGGLKTFQEKYNKNDEFKGLQGNFKLITIYTDSTEKVNGEDVNLFDRVWSNHYSLFETMADGTYLPNTFYAQNKTYTQSNYENAFTSDKLDECPMSAPLLMFFDYTDANKVENQKVKGLSDIIFAVDGSSDLEKARTLKNCWAHTDIFGELKKN